MHKYFLYFLDGAQPFKITVAPNDSSILLHGIPPDEIFATEPFSFIPDLILGKQFVAIGGGSVERSLNLVTKSPIAPNLLIEKKHVPTNVSFSVENLPVWAHLDQKTGEIFGTPFYNQLGDFKNIKITAVSGDEMATLPAFDIKVVFRDDDPQISIVPKLSAYVGVKFRYDLDVKTLSERNQNHTFASELPIWLKPYQLNEFFKSDDGQIKYRRDSSANTMPSWLRLDGDQWYISGKPLLSDVGVHEGIELTFRFRADSGPGIDKMYFSPVSVFTIEVFDDPTKQPPSLTLRGEELEGDTSRDLTYTDYSDGSFTISAEDPQDGGITDKIIKTGSVDRNIPWLYPVTYSVTDSDGNVSTATFKVRVMASDYRVVDSVAPVITLIGSASVSLEVGATYTDAGATALDNVDGDITGSVSLSGTVDVNTVGAYTLTYSASDATGNVATSVTRTVVVEKFTEIQTLSLNEGLEFGLVLCGTN